MRRFAATCLACLVAFSIPAGAHAQSIGFKLGGSLATQDFKPDASRNSLGGFGGGGFVRFGFSRMGLQLEVLALTKGSEAVENSVERKINYVEVPLLLHVPLMSGPSFAPYVIMGPSLAFDIDCEEVGEVTNACPERETMDIGVNLGGGLGVAAGPGALLLEGRHTWGLKNISEDPALEVKNRSALFIIGYELPLGRR
jgi:hypothetical protein